MIKAYFTTSFRSLKRNKLITALNVAGLAVGLATGMLILKYVQDEFSYDQFHKRKNNIYRVQHNFLREGELDFKSARTFPKVGPALQDEFPEVANYCRVFQKYKGGAVSYEDKSFNEDNILYASPSFLDMFSYELIEGDKTSALNEVHTALITPELSAKLFGNADPLGKRISIGSTSGIEEFEVRGVIRSPENSHLEFDVVLSYASLIALWGENADTAWSWYDFYTYLELQAGASPTELEEKLPAFVDKHGGESRGSKRVQLLLQPLTDIHLHSDLMMEASINGDAETVYFLTLLAIAILLIAWINYLNLATAGAMERAKEVGVRKVIGASRLQLGFQFLAEAAMINAMSILVSFLLIYVALPFYNSFAGLQIAEKDLFLDLAFWDRVLLLFLLGTLLSGIY
ncbi:MAG: ABC transporter permease, partial [Cyclobacteriaceae bacterium]